MRRKNLDISIVIPVYNEEQVIESSINELLKELSNIECSFEIIFVDDGSNDSTIDILKRSQSEYTSIKFLSFTRNFGHQYALLAGIHRATGSAVIMMDSDLQHPPSLIPKLIDQWRSGSMVVQTIRKDINVGLFKKISSKLFYCIINLISNIKLNPATADFRLMDRAVVTELLKFNESDIFLRGIIPWLGFTTTYVEYNAVPRIAGKSKYSFLKMFNLALSGITSLSTLPLKFTIIIGLIISLTSFYFGIEAIAIRILTDSAVPGWASVMVGVFFIGGLSMIFMGVLGEYLGKIFIEVKKRPRFIIKEMSGFDDEE